MALFPEEKEITSAVGKAIQLTTHRIQGWYGAKGSEYYVSIMLEKVTSVQLREISSPGLLVVGFVVLLGGLLLIPATGEPAMGLVGLLGVIFIVLYFTSKYHRVSINGYGGVRIHFMWKGKNKADIMRFLDQVEYAKLNRMERLTKAYENMG